MHVYQRALFSTKFSSAYVIANRWVACRCGALFDYKISKFTARSGKISSSIERARCTHAAQFPAHPTHLPPSKVSRRSCYKLTCSAHFKSPRARSVDYRFCRFGFSVSAHRASTTVYESTTVNSINISCTPKRWQKNAKTSRLGAIHYLFG